VGSFPPSTDRDQLGWEVAEELVRFITAPMTANVILVLAWAYAGYHISAH
jgi:hypothetical protein